MSAESIDHTAQAERAEDNARLLLKEAETTPPEDPKAPLCAFEAQAWATLAVAHRTAEQTEYLLGIREGLPFAGRGT